MIGYNRYTLLKLHWKVNRAAVRLVLGSLAKVQYCEKLTSRKKKIEANNESIKKRSRDEELNRTTRGHTFLFVQIGYTCPNEMSAGLVPNQRNRTGEQIRMTEERQKQEEEA